MPDRLADDMGHNRHVIIPRYTGIQQKFFFLDAIRFAYYIEKATILFSTKQKKPPTDVSGLLDTFCVRICGNRFYVLESPFSSFYEF